MTVPLIFASFAVLCDLCANEFHHAKLAKDRKARKEAKAYFNH